MLNLVYVVGVPNFIFVVLLVEHLSFIDYCICCNDLGIRPQNAKVKLWPFGFIVVVSFCLIVFSCWFSCIVILNFQFTSVIDQCSSARNKHILELSLPRNSLTSVKFYSYFRDTFFSPLTVAEATVKYLHPCKGIGCSNNWRRAKWSSLKTKTLKR